MSLLACAQGLAALVDVACVQNGPVHPSAGAGPQIGLDADPL